MQKTFIQKPADLKRDWQLMDAEDRVLGVIATEIAVKLIGKDKKIYTPNVDCGDYVVVINANKVVLTGKKESNKLYRHHTGYLGHLKTKTAGEMRAEFPDRIIKLAVQNMLPKNKLRASRMKRLKVYAGAEHPHGSQFSAK